MFVEHGRQLYKNAAVEVGAGAPYTQRAMDKTYRFVGFALGSFATVHYVASPYFAGETPDAPPTAAFLSSGPGNWNCKHGHVFGHQCDHRCRVQRDAPKLFASATCSISEFPASLGVRTHATSERVHLFPSLERARAVQARRSVGAWRHWSGPVIKIIIAAIVLSTTAANAAQLTCEPSRGDGRVIRLTRSKLVWSRTAPQVYGSNTNPNPINVKVRNSKKSSSLPQHTSEDGRYSELVVEQRHVDKSHNIDLSFPPTIFFLSIGAKRKLPRSLFRSTGIPLQLLIIVGIASGLTEGSLSFPPGLAGEGLL